jgi:hypothetical protein
LTSITSDNQAKQISPFERREKNMPIKKVKRKKKEKKSRRRRREDDVIMMKMLLKMPPYTCM